MHRTCPACGFQVSPQTCPVCGWIDDLGQLVQPDFVVGANPRSLREAQVLARGLINSVHERDPKWRPLRPGEHPVASGSASPVCYLGTPDPDEFVPYWLN